ncbi:unnamed protein product [Polarella glacialis]|uniref:RING-type domain-containing protein n=1 Tax=Polarella glacialis TaxID=89957 RepID=A0A813K3W8_POLGL|nr:unnamed protein product [Polarella glacialis]
MGTNEPGGLPALPSMAPDPEADTCCICLESLDSPGRGRQALPCQRRHMLHEDCITEMRRHGASGYCPLCREELGGLEPFQVLLDRVALCYMQASYDEAYRLASEVHDLDFENPEAAALLGTLLAQGNGVTKDLQQAEAFYRTASKHGHLSATFNLALLLEDRGELQQAEAFYRTASSQGHPNATFNLACLLEDRGDLQQAEVLYRTASSQGHLKATFNLAILLQNRGDLQQAEAFYRTASSQGYLQATVNLALLLEDRGDLQQAEALYRTASSQGHLEATFNLAHLLHQRADLQQAEVLYRTASSQGHLEATFNLALLLAQLGDVQQTKRRKQDC